MALLAQLKCKKVIHLTPESANNHALNLEDEHGIKPQIYQCNKHGEAIIYHVGYTARERRKFTPSSRKKYEKAHSKKIKSTEYINKKENKIMKDDNKQQKIACTQGEIENIFSKLVSPPVDKVLSKNMATTAKTIAPIIENNNWQISIGGTSYAKSTGKMSNVKMYLERKGSTRKHVQNQAETVLKSWMWNRLTNTNYGTISTDEMYAFLKEIVEVVRSEDLKLKMVSNPPAMADMDNATSVNVVNNDEDLVDPIEEHLTELLFGLVQIPSTKLRSRIHEVAQEATPLLKKHQLILQYQNKKLYPYRLSLENKLFRTEIRVWNLNHVNGMPTGKVKEFELFRFMEEFLTALLVYPLPVKAQVTIGENGTPPKIEYQKLVTAVTQESKPKSDDVPALVMALMPPESVITKTSKPPVTVTMPKPKCHILATVGEVLDNGLNEIKIEFYSKQGLEFLKSCQGEFWGQFKPTPPNKVSLLVNPSVWSVEEIVEYINSYKPNDNKENN